MDGDPGLDRSKVKGRLIPYMGIASEESRYSPWDAINAAALISAIADPIHGVLQWLKKYY
jgi:hypothetical protein